MAVKTPHILLAASNTRKMLENLRNVLDVDAYDVIEQEINKNVISLFELGNEHFRFAQGTEQRFWRQRISRLYYGAYNVRRAIALHFKGAYHTDVSDHKNISDIPDDFPHTNIYKTRLIDLREDRNLADYDHTAVEADLLLTQDEAETLVSDFIRDARNYLNNRGFTI